MCGIAGVMFFDGARRGRANDVVAHMLAALQHRGPDGEGTWESVGPGDPAVALAHRRLAIIDLSDAARQPMTAVGGRSITYNGETYNFRDLQRQLKAHGAQFHTSSDTEVVLRAYDQWGVDAVPRLHGMFAFAIWDGAARRLLLARDRLGIKPLYYVVTREFVVFASEVRALLATGLVERRLDTSSLWHYLGYQTAPTPATLVTGVRMLEPGHWMTVEATGQVESRRYWDLLESRDQLNQDVALPQAVDRTRELLDEAVTSHLVSDVPVGIFLSGGIDSSALVSCLRSQGRHAQTFTVSLAEAGYDESHQAKAVASRFGMEHTECRLSEGDLLDALLDALAAIDHPSGDGINTFVISRFVRQQGIKVALSGLGGDEFFGGYPSFRRLGQLMPLARQLSRSPTSLRRVAAGVARTVSRSVASAKAVAVMEGDGSLADVWPVTRQLLSQDQREALMPRFGELAASQRDSYQRLLAEAFARHPNADPWAQVSYAEARTYMHDVLLRDTDQMSMAHGLEVRVPLLDHRLIDYVMGLPDRVKSYDRTAKPLLVGSLPLALPSDLIDQPKRGFTLPFDRWMRDGLRPLCEEHLGERGLEGRRIFKSGQVLTLWRRFLAGASDVTWSRLWMLVALDAWLDRHALRGDLA